MQEPSHGALTFDAAFGFCWWGGVPLVEKKLLLLLMMLFLCDTSWKVGR
jgi:hypothetical protein